MADASISTNALLDNLALKELFVATNQAVSSANVPMDSKANLTREVASKKLRHHPVAALKILARLENNAFRPTLRQLAVESASVPEAGFVTKRPVCVVTLTNVSKHLLINLPAASEQFVKICPAVTTVLVRKATKAIRSSVATSAIRSNVVVNHLTV